jgi:hypothetical protein
MGNWVVRKKKKMERPMRIRPATMLFMLHSPELPVLPDSANPGGPVD